MRPQPHCTRGNILHCIGVPEQQHTPQHQCYMHADCCCPRLGWHCSLSTESVAIESHCVILASSPTIWMGCVCVCKFIIIIIQFYLYCNPTLAKVPRVLISHHKNNFSFINKKRPPTKLQTRQVNKTSQNKTIQQQQLWQSFNNTSEKKCQVSLIQSFIDQ